MTGERIQDNKLACWLLIAFLAWVVAWGYA